MINNFILNAMIPSQSMNSTCLLVCIGAGSSLAVQLLLLLEQIKLPSDKRPDYKKFIYYWPYIINPALGAFLVYVYVISQDFPLTPLLAFHIGASAPLIIRTMFSTIPSGFQDSLQNPSRQRK